MKQSSAQIRAINKVEAGFRLATLVGESHQGYLLDDDGLQHIAGVAFSCLVKPLSGDQVLYASAESGQSIIVSIVSRPGDQTMQLDFPQDVCLSSAAGSVNLSAEQSISLSSSRLNTLAKTTVQKSDEAYLQVKQLHADGEKLNANFKSIMVISGLISTLAKQAVSKFKTYLRHSEDFDQVKSANMTRSVKGLLNMNSGHTVMVSKNDTKIDAERIHIG